MLASRDEALSAPFEVLKGKSHWMRMSFLVVQEESELPAASTEALQSLLSAVMTGPGGAPCA